MGQAKPRIQAILFEEGDCPATMLYALKGISAPGTAHGEHVMGFAHGPLVCALRSLFVNGYRFPCHDSPLCDSIEYASFSSCKGTGYYD